jgi:hypothetical protein
MDRQLLRRLPQSSLAPNSVVIFSLQFIRLHQEALGRLASERRPARAVDRYGPFILGGETLIFDVAIAVVHARGLLLVLPHPERAPRLLQGPVGLLSHAAIHPLLFHKGRFLLIKQPTGTR